MAQFEKKLAHVFQTGCTFGRLAPVSPSPRPSPTRGEGETPIRESRPPAPRLSHQGRGKCWGSVGVRRKMDAGGGAIHKHPLSDVTRLPSDRAGGNPWPPPVHAGAGSTDHKQVINTGLPRAVTPAQERHPRTPYQVRGRPCAGMTIRGLDGLFSQAWQLGYRTSYFIARSQLNATRLRNITDVSDVTQL